MEIKRFFLASKVARRVFLLFAGCVLFPLFILTLISFNHVSLQLEDQSLARIRQAAKIHGLSIFERLLSMENDMRVVAAMALKGSGSIDFTDSADFYSHKISRSFDSLSLMKSGRMIDLYGQMTELPELEGQLATITGKRTAILLLPKTGEHSHVYMVLPLEDTPAGIDLLIGQLNINFLWGIGYENLLPPMTELCILDHSRRVLTTNFRVADSLLQNIFLSKAGQSGKRQLEYRDGERSYFVSYWPLFLKSRFDAPTLTIVLQQAKSDILAPMDNFKRIFPLVVLLALWVVLLLSSTFIRRTMSPIEKLKEGIGRVARRDFAVKVEVDSGDEFEELAASFNGMSGELDRQFKNLVEISRISHALFSSLSKTEIVTTALIRMQQFFACDSVSIFLLQGQNAVSARVYQLVAAPEQKIREELIELPADDLQVLFGDKRYLFLNGPDDLPGFLPAGARSGEYRHLLLPLSGREGLTGIVSLGCANKEMRHEDDLLHARQLADEFAVALSKLALLEEFEELSWGTLEALARTVDAKSSWTAGHSERVTHIAVNIAQAMKCSPGEIETIQRAGLIHDIGKVGVPRAILDKPGRLTPEEFETIKEHPLIGARILTPIKVFADVVPMVLQHHERYDGNGYPHGLAGDSISLGGRILAVADVYDALISERPYREGWVKERVLDLIKEKTGTDFDPEVVKAFLMTIS